MRSLPTRRNPPHLCGGVPKKKSTCPKKFKGRKDLWEESNCQKIAICEQIESSLSISKSGRLPKGKVKAIIDCNIELSPWLTPAMIHGLLKRRKAKGISNQNMDTSSSIIPTPSNTNIDQERIQQVLPKKPGRPKGSLYANQVEHNHRFEKMKNTIVEGWVNKSKRPQTKNLNEWILHNQKEYGFGPADLISLAEKKMYSVQNSFVYSQMSRGSFISKGKADQAPPLAKIEPRIVMFINLSTKCNQELTSEEIIAFVNSYIHGSKLEEEYIAWKVTHHRKRRSDYVESDTTYQKGDSVGEG